MIRKLTVGIASVAVVATLITPEALSNNETEITCEVGDVNQAQEIVADYGFILSEDDSVCVNVEDPQDFTIPDEHLLPGTYKVTFEADDIKRIKKLDK